MPRTITVVLDTSFGDKVEKLAFRSVVWLVESEVNRAACASTMRHVEEWPQLSITMFRSIPATREEWSRFLSLIELHHGNLNQTRALDRLEVLGQTLTPEVQAALEEGGFTAVQATVEGFHARRRE